VVYGEGEAGGTHVLHALTETPREHGLPVVGPARYPQHHIPLGKKIGGVLTLTGGIEGKVRSVTNAVTKPWRLKYRYWHRPEPAPLPDSDRYTASKSDAGARGGEL
jgi:hypothetical protein